jgi:NNP family nitrate/nitrite transporter-like MFS transporter
LPDLQPMMLCLVVGMMCLGLGNGAVFQIVPQGFRDQIGVATGIIGAVGGLGGFFLPALLGAIKQVTGSFELGFLALGSVALLALVLIRVLMATNAAWATSWRGTAVIEQVRHAA